VQYAGASGDFYPLHTDEVFATQVAGQPTVIAHGMLTMAMSGRVLTDLLGHTGVRRFGGRFRAPVRPGDDLDLVGTVAARRCGPPTVVRIDFTTCNQHGTVVFEGTFEAEV
jgi:acyl dehydratase